MTGSDNGKQVMWALAATVGQLGTVNCRSQVAMFPLGSFAPGGSPLLLLLAALFLARGGTSHKTIAFLCSVAVS